MEGGRLWATTEPGILRRAWNGRHLHDRECTAVDLAEIVGSPVRRERDFGIGEDI